jgi:hypothetical protein
VNFEKKFGTYSFELKKGKKFENPVVSTIDKKLSGGINMGHLTKSSPASYVQEEPEETKVKDGFLSRNKLYFIHSMAYAIGKEWIHRRRQENEKDNHFPTFEYFSFQNTCIESTA